MLSYMLAQSWRNIPVLNTSLEGVPLGVAVHHFMVPHVPWSLLSMRLPNLSLFTCFMCLYCIISRTGFVFITYYMFLWMGFLLHLSAWIALTTIPFPLGGPVYRGGSVSIAVCCVGYLPYYQPGVLFLHPHIYMAHRSLLTKSPY